MTPLGCDEARDLLPAFHDAELSLEQAIAVEQHLEWCSPCTWEVRRLAAIGDGLRGAASVINRVEEPGPLQPAVLSRLRAEEQQRLPATIARMFEDMHLVWAAVGATTAATLCVTIILTMLSFAAPSPGRADSLAGLLSMMSSPSVPVPKPAPLDGRMSMPRVDLDQTMPVMVMSADVAEDRVFALAGIVTPEGRLTHLEVVMANQRNHEDVARMLDVASTARFQPARLNDSPVAVNMVWLVARTTVRARS
jgi:anti-sigma factor RsiW